MRAAVLAASAALASSALPAFSWQTLQPFAFPGAAPRFMTPLEVDYFVFNFSNVLIWGLNASCLEPARPASCPAGDSHCWCNQTHPESQVWALNMETSLQAQGAALQTAAAAAGKGSSFFVLGYIEYLSIQQYYAAQMALVTNASLAGGLLRVESKGLIDCFTDGCNWQGTEFRQYDLRQPAVQQYYVDAVIGSLIAGPGLAGTFLDSIDWWATSACQTWPCTEAEAVDLTLASLQTLAATLDKAVALDKIISVSSHTDLATSRDFYLQQCAILAARKAHAIRFWEFFQASENHLESLIYETQTLGLATQVHVQDRTLNPSWVELAVFLLGAGENSYFSVSKPWNINSFDVFPEFSLPLGAPAGPAVRTTTAAPPTAPWALLPAQNLIYNLPPPPPWTPGQGIPGTLAYLGAAATADACLALVRANASFTAMTFVGANDKEWSLTCWGRLDEQDWAACIGGEVETPPCSAAAEAVCVSAVAAPLSRNVTTWSRSFEHLAVTWWPTNGSAVLLPL